MTGIKIKNKGFTLVELVVAMAVFLFIIGAAITVFLSIIQHQKTVLQEQKVLNQLSYAIEHMSKALRMAKKAETEDSACITTDPPLCAETFGCAYMFTKYDMVLGYPKGVKFINQSDSNACTEFYLEGKVLYEVKDGGLAVALTSEDLNINSIRFSAKGGQYGAPGYNYPIQPEVTFRLNVQISEGEQERVFQTTVSQRNLFK